MRTLTKKIKLVHIKYWSLKREFMKKEKKIELNDYQKEVATTLIEFIKENKNQTIYYSDLAEKVGRSKRAAQSMGATLGKISRLCNKCNLPMLSAIVCNKRKHNPSEGFFRLYSELKNNGKELPSKEEKYKILRKEQKAVKMTDWSKLKSYL